jgi:hypothetical protein
MKGRTDHAAWEKEFGRQDALFVRQTAQFVHETVSLGFDEKPLFVFYLCCDWI